MGQVRVAGFKEMNLDLSRDTEGNDFDFLAAHALDMVVVRVCLADALVTKEAFSEVDDLRQTTLREFLQAPK